MFGTVIYIIHSCEYTSPTTFLLCPQTFLPDFPIFIVNFVTCYLHPAPDTPTQTAILPPFYGISPAPHIHAAGSLHASLPHRTDVVLPPYPRPASRGCAA